MNTHRGFIQIPLLIAIVAGFLVVGGAGYLGWKQFKNHPRSSVTGPQVVASTTSATTTTQVSEIDQLKQEVEDLKTQVKTNQTNNQKVTPPPVSSTDSSRQTINYGQIPLKSVVRLVCFVGKEPWQWANEGGDVYGGSGVVIDNSGLILTNAHVIGYNQDTTCSVAIQNDLQQAQLAEYKAVVQKLYSGSDIATLAITNKIVNGQWQSISTSTVFPSTSKFCIDSDVELGDKLVVAGYPTVGGFSITLTEGIVSGFDNNYVKTSAKIEHGNSGGAAYDSSGCFIGIPTEVSAGSLESLGYILRIDPFLKRLIMLKQ